MGSSRKLTAAISWKLVGWKELLADFNRKCIVGDQEKNHFTLEEDWEFLQKAHLPT